MRTLTGKVSLQSLEVLGHVAPLIAAVIAVVLHYLDMLEHERLWELTLVLVTFLVLIEFLKFRERSSQREDITSINQALGRIEQASEARILLVKCPRETDDYVRLWSGFEGDYAAYNPAFRIEYFSAVDRQAIIERVFVPRYRNACKAKYLFLTKDGADDLKKFRALMLDVKKLYPELKDKLTVSVLAGMAASEDSEFYLGTKHGQKISIFEPKELAREPRRGEPDYYLIVTNEDVNEKLHQRFDDQWKKASEVKDFLSSP